MCQLYLLVRSSCDKSDIGGARGWGRVGGLTGPDLKHAQMCVSKSEGNEFFLIVK